MQSERRYKVEKYLEMARLTKNGDRKEELIDKAEYFLEISESEMSNGHEEYDEIEYFADLKLEDVLNRPMAECYREYEVCCRKNGEKIVSKVKFTKMVSKKFGTYSKSVRVNNKTTKVYVMEEK